ncbi:TetR/AcrR family transcriptional regulator [Rhodoligotrophos defluvii]|uniref:TetR/AcrR family transcriptional regulator n=1 Tax=Rhodoligotrophos defluvii TaxID=2561934 RepID=UPI0014856511|nr:TetR family transcriptional regulator [Rhodoligotrophos defluvii]
MTVSETVKRPRGRPSSKAQILDAAAAVVAEVGANHLTLEAVAERAGVSKGGLLYNYATKDALLQAMVERFVDECVSRREALAAELGGDKRGELRALLLARCKGEEGARKMAHGMLAAVAENPRLLDPAREAQADVTRILRNADNPVDAAVAWLALEGLAFLDLLDVCPFNAEERERIVDRVMAIADS